MPKWLQAVFCMGVCMHGYVDTLCSEWVFFVCFLYILLSTWTKTSRGQEWMEKYIWIYLNVHFIAHPSIFCCLSFAGIAGAGANPSLASSGYATWREVSMTVRTTAPPCIRHAQKSSATCIIKDLNFANTLWWSIKVQICTPSHAVMLLCVNGMLSGAFLFFFFPTGENIFLNPAISKLRLSSKQWCYL